GPRWPSSKDSAWGRRAPGPKPDSTEDPSRIGPAARPPMAKRPLACASRKLGEGAPGQISSPASDRDSKLRSSPKIAFVLLQNWALL
ncbi:hypothetical protein AVEN_143262-2-1, partial [Araneus ventricosus]